MGNKDGGPLNNPSPQDVGDLETFVAKKRDLLIELNHLGLMEDQC